MFYGLLAAILAIGGFRAMIGIADADAPVGAVAWNAALLWLHYAWYSADCLRFPAQSTSWCLFAVTWPVTLPLHVFRTRGAGKMAAAVAIWIVAAFAGLNLGALAAALVRAAHAK